MINSVTVIEYNCMADMQSSHLSYCLLILHQLATQGAEGRVHLYQVSKCHDGYGRIENVR